MRRSIRKQMIAVFVGLLLCMLLILLAVDVFWLEPYYIRYKEDSFEQMYEKLNTAVENGIDLSEEEKKTLSYETERYNFSYIIYSFEDKQGLSSEHDGSLLLQQLTGILLDRQRQLKLLKRTDDYQIIRFDDVSQTEYLALYGVIEGKYNVFIRSPIESIQESMVIFNRFLISVGGAVILAGILLVWYFSRKLTEPIMELAALSAKMADLDFEAHYTSGGENEIGILGENFNVMSRRLEKTISELKSANFQLQKDIEQKEKMEQMRTDFMGNVSHELKTPIALIQGYAEGLKEGISDDPESREFYCDVIMDEAAKMNQMVKNLMTLNQLEFGNEEVQFERFDIAELIRGVLGSMEILIQQKEARVQFNAPGAVYVWADEFKAEQIVRNYVSNALNHLDGEKVIDVKVIPGGDKVRVTVFNTGMPIPEEDLPHIWEKFYKVDKSHTRAYGGNGIGLSIVKAIMDSFHQKYGVNNYDNGVEFWFELDEK